MVWYRHTGTGRSVAQRVSGKGGAKIMNIKENSQIQMWLGRTHIGQNNEIIQPHTAVHKHGQI
jgi:hypothetical protein